MYTVCIEVKGTRSVGRNRRSLKQAESAAREWFNEITGWEAAGLRFHKWAVLILDNKGEVVQKFKPKRKR